MNLLTTIVLDQLRKKKKQKVNSPPSNVNWAYFTYAVFLFFCGVTMLWIALGGPGY